MKGKMMTWVLMIKPKTRQPLGLRKTDSFPLSAIRSLGTERADDTRVAFFCLQSSFTYINSFDLFSNLQIKQTHFTDEMDQRSDLPEETQIVF